MCKATDVLSSRAALSRTLLFCRPRSERASAKGAARACGRARETPSNPNRCSAGLVDWTTSSRRHASLWPGPSAGSCAGCAHSRPRRATRVVPLPPPLSAPAPPRRPAAVCPTTPSVFFRSSRSCWPLLPWRPRCAPATRRGAWTAPLDACDWFGGLRRESTRPPRDARTDGARVG